MVQEFRAKVFKSGNSLAVRLPKGLGAIEGTEMIVREDRGTFTFEPANTQRKITGDGWMGALPWLSLGTPEDREFDHSPRPWDDPDWPSAA